MSRHALTGILSTCLLALVVSACSVSIGKNPPPPPPPPPARIEHVTIQGLNLRQGPSVTTGVIRSLSLDEAVEVLARQDNWIRVRTMDGLVGYAYGAYLTGFDIRPARRDPGKPAPPGGSSGLSPEEEQELWN
ncbi:SH3 domain-containing protein [Desulfolutivibrio sulfoxidireducens]|uniref:SH3 domain-containing protein n=1 Tax=Desulfolutivibrio sulfoxidireducens TaxID=2773299 RepID=UPI00159DFF54|nr:SH3 domain-containing protein [Desulfolutivibrio sulfoxidireducens]